jgi:hypothetical protein
VPVLLTPLEQLKTYPHLVIEVGTSWLDASVYWLDPKTGERTNLSSVTKIAYGVEVDELDKAMVTFTDVEIVQR